ncbi:unnamed protein product [Protopolystoma xenopodis]|uniref:Uncharacterized protein n=1 Tax=Protopolystoma xenopodis TaxID=117903 RepID=A0A448X4J0_9PLAT|nr:unnamed protein product [Protopolystoma xenopodis]
MTSGPRLFVVVAQFSRTSQANANKHERVTRESRKRRTTLRHKWTDVGGLAEKAATKNDSVLQHFIHSMQMDKVEWLPWTDLAWRPDRKVGMGTMATAKPVAQRQLSRHESLFGWRTNEEAFRMRSVSRWQHKVENLSVRSPSPS